MRIGSRIGSDGAAHRSSASTLRRAVRPIAIGDALVRLAEKTLAMQLKDAFIAHLMPHQVGVGVPGGLNMWATVVEAMLQRDHEAVMCD